MRASFVPLSAFGTASQLRRRAKQWGEGRERGRGYPRVPLNGTPSGQQVQSKRDLLQARGQTEKLPQSDCLARPPPSTLPPAPPFPAASAAFAGRCKLAEIFIIFLTLLLISCAFSCQMHCTNLPEGGRERDREREIE